MKRIILTMMTAILALGSNLGANPLEAQDFDFNPALINFRNRGLVELGMSVDAGVNNSYFSVGSFFQPELLIDIDDIHNWTGTGDFHIGSFFDTEVHLAMTLFDIGVGFYTRAEGLVSVPIPGSLFELLSEGNELNRTYSDSSQAVGRAYAEAGLIGSYQWENFWFSVGMAAFSPIIYSSPDANFSYRMRLNSDGTGEFAAGLEMPFYSAFSTAELENMDPSVLMSRLNGLKLDLGAVYMRRGKPIWGASLGGLTVRNAVVSNRLTLTYDGTGNLQSLLGIVGDDTAEPFNFTQDDFATTEETGGSFEVGVPVSLGGFYRLQNFPFMIDWIFHGSMIFDNPFMMNLGVTATGSFFPLSIVSVGIEYDRYAFKSNVDLSLNLWLMELGVGVSTASSDFLGIFTAKGLSARLYFAMGL